MYTTALFLLATSVIALVITLGYLRGPDLSAFNGKVGDYFDMSSESAAARKAVEETLAGGMGSIETKSRKERLKRLREYMDSISDDQDINATLIPVDAGGVPAEWVLAPGVDTSRRVLYIHGGAFMMGSPKSHRNITSSFSREANAAVLAIDYRLMPENSRMAGIEDCRTAYRWLLEHGPDGPGEPTRVYMGGDSAGGNLTLAMTAWIRDTGLRQVDAAVALSPVTDVTFNAPSIRDNIDSDQMLGPMFSEFINVPNAVLLWVGWLQNRMSPSNPLVSPVFGDLSGLPPTLLHASETEILRDDSRRYVNKARAAGSPVELQTWNLMPHVWHMFYPELPEANAAWDAIGAFVKRTDIQAGDLPEAA